MDWPNLACLVTQAFTEQQSHDESAFHRRGARSAGMRLAVRGGWSGSVGSLFTGLFK